MERADSRKVQGSEGCCLVFRAVSAAQVLLAEEYRIMEV